MKERNQHVWKPFSGPNIGYLHDLYEMYKEDPKQVNEEVKELFDTYGPPWEEEPTGGEANEADIQAVISALKLLNNIRNFGHLAADIHPLKRNDRKDNPPFLKLDSYQLTKEKLKKIRASYVWRRAPKEITNGWEAYLYLQKVYTGPIAYEFGHIHDEQEREWLEGQIENHELPFQLNKEQRIELYDRLLQVESFEKFLHKTFVGQKRFSIEGIAVLVPMLDQLTQASLEDAVETISIGMAHRGRLNVLAHVLDKPYELIFSEFHQSPDKELVPSEGSSGINNGWSGDVKYHLGANREIQNEQDRSICLKLANNPSHLEFVNPVVQGITRALQDDRTEEGFPKQQLNEAYSVVIHGDAAFPGEGVVAETLNISQLKGYGTGGTIHIISNNEIGFTTDFTDSRSTKYASDLAKGFEIPIVHVNADYPESCLAVLHLAYEYRKRFKKDILIDLVGYRRFGHNEMDDPSPTQPILYDIVKKHPTVAAIYLKELQSKNILDEQEAKQKADAFMDDLQERYEAMKTKNEEENRVPDPPKAVMKEVPKLNTSVSVERLKKINGLLLQIPNSFEVYPKLTKILERRSNVFEEGGKIDWAHAELMAFATILTDGKPVRLTGQDSERGTFAQRHLVLHDRNKNRRYIPLHHLGEGTASFSVYNSPLSEAAALGFEYGYSVQAYDALILWEAQFGDFVNAAQVILDQFIAAGRAKWGQTSSIVLLLPHGYEGQGPEHSSGRLERFLQASAENNWIVANVTSAAQYFHLLRRQAWLTDKEEARPLILMTPKSLLRNPLTASTVEAFTNGSFSPLYVTQRKINQEKVKRIIFCSGKIAVDLQSKLEELPDTRKKEICIARLEQLYPFPEDEVKALLTAYPDNSEVVWVQEEPQNMGAWFFIKEAFEQLSDKRKIRYIGRTHRSSPATGEPVVHKQEQQQIVEGALQEG